MRVVEYLQTLVLLGGTIFAWSTVSQELTQGFPLGTTMCFYGAIAFTVAVLISIYLLFISGRLDQKWQQYLTWLLGAGTVFAWGNWGYVAYKLFREEQCLSACPVGITNPFLTPCFYGASIYLIGFIIALVLLYRSNSKTDIS